MNKSYHWGMKMAERKSRRNRENGENIGSFCCRDFDSLLWWNESDFGKWRKSGGAVVGLF